MMVSSCCLGGLIAESSKEGTGFFRCARCMNPCDQIRAEKEAQPLALVPIETLIKEIFTRCEEVVIITKRSEDAKDPVIRCMSKAGNPSGIGLCQIAASFFLHNVLETYEKGD